MTNLTPTEASQANTLFRKYVSTSRPLDLLEAMGCIRRETRNAEKGIIKVTPGLLSELRSDRAKIGRLVRKEIGRRG